MISNLLNNALKSRSSRRQAAKIHRARVRKLTFDQLEMRAMLAANVVGDFNGDGADDLAIGVNETTGGAVNVIYGTGNGLASTGNQLWTQNSSGILDESEGDDRFGGALAVGDFNNDSFDDLAVGVPGESVAGNDFAGSVNVIYGSPNGLQSAGNQFWNQNSSGILDQIDGSGFGGEHFGSALATGDFNHDGVDDLAIGAPDESSQTPFGGVVHVIYGVTAVGLTSANNQLWSQDSSGILDASEPEDFFGTALASGDFDGDGRDDLAIGAAGETVGAIGFEAGAVNIIYATDTGLSSARNQFFHQDSSGVQDAAEDTDYFGSSLAAGNFNGDAYDDLAIGIQWEDIGDVTDAGAVSVLYGGDRSFELGAAGATEFGLTAAGNQFWNQNSSGIADVAESNQIPESFAFGDSFGAVVAAGDLNGDSIDDLTVGVPGESTESVLGFGVAQIIFGSVAGLTSAQNQLWSQNSIGVLDAAEQADIFGSAICIGDFNGDGRKDLSVAAAGESLTGVSLAGAVHVIYGSDTGLTTVGNQLWHQNSSGILDEAEENELFGSALPGSNNLPTFVFALVSAGT